MTRNALGKGLSALIREPEALQPSGPAVPSATPSSPSGAAAVAPARAPEAASQAAPNGVLQIDIDLISPSPFQPRTRFSPEALEELAQSIRQTGIIQPIVVRRNGPRYELLAGERRWRAAQLASLHRVPAVVQDVSDEKAIEITLVENLQREDLNPIEQATAFDRLIQEFHLTQEEAALRTGKDRVTVSNAVRLLRLDKPIRQMVEEGRLNAGHARALLAIEDEALRLETAKRAARGSLTVRQIERFASKTRRRAKAQQEEPSPIDANTRAAIDELQRVLGTRVTIHPQAHGRPGQLIVEYYTEADLDRLYRFIVER
jgi:ParB family transcriptional regulator, chromosome partitioning protein